VHFTAFGQCSVLTGTAHSHFRALRVVWESLDFCYRNDREA